MNKQAIFDALAKIPDGVWPAYLMALKGVNRAVGNFVLDDPTPADELDKAIEKELHGK